MRQPSEDTKTFNQENIDFRTDENEHMSFAHRQFKDLHMLISSVNFWRRLGDTVVNLATVLLIATVCCFIAAFASKSGAAPALQSAEVLLPITAILTACAIFAGNIVRHIEQKLSLKI